MIRAFPDIRFGIVFIGSRRQDWRDGLHAAGQRRTSGNPFPVRLSAAADGERQRGRPARLREVRRALHEMLREPGKEQGGGRTDPANWSTGAARGRGRCPRTPSSTAAAPGRPSPSSIASSARTRRLRTTSGPCASCTSRCGSWCACADSLTAGEESYHTVSTGYAGFLGALPRYRHRAAAAGVRARHLYQGTQDRPVRRASGSGTTAVSFERDISPDQLLPRAVGALLRERWAELCYDAGRRHRRAVRGQSPARQVADGALEARTRNIPNGINLPTRCPALLTSSAPGRARRVLSR